MVVLFVSGSFGRMKQQSVFTFAKLNCTFSILAHFEMKEFRKKHLLLHNAHDTAAFKVKV